MLAVAMGAVPAASACAETLDSLQWSRRVVLAFAVPGSERADDLRAAVERSACRLADRDLAVYLVRDAAPEPIDGAAPSLSSERAADLRAVFRPRDPRFEMVLIGKDGGLKARSADPDDLDRFFELIDGMPMRRQEMAARAVDCEPR